MEISGPIPVEYVIREAYAGARRDDMSHEEAIVEALCGAVGIGYDDAHLARVARTLVEIDEEDGQ